MPDKDTTWDQLVADHQLADTTLGELASRSFADAAWNMGFDLVQSTIKVRRGGPMVNAVSTSQSSR